MSSVREKRGFARKAQSENKSLRDSAGSNDRIRGHEPRRVNAVDDEIKIDTGINCRIGGRRDALLVGGAKIRGAHASIIAAKRISSRGTALPPSNTFPNSPFNR